MTNSPKEAAASQWSEAQMADLLVEVKKLTALVGPLTALASGAAQSTSGAGDRVEELIQQLSAVSETLLEAGKELSRLTETLVQVEPIDRRLSALEAATEQQSVVLAAIGRDLRAALSWMHGTA
ncbi:hypothetical protein U879_03370 [Defluviimonas sp. 20V17]|uniref:Uncharacterized protein n=1 Tax=Allgaiera indica TaxID=765699 RepID=A0AAN4UTY0_9RHOB|nr:hypothetical protein [Allgaiera indica]KDB05092.1 hypothetical protein U879_03370 [Defluviimonas sp. 20V17]GHE04469.1 hypothetical protein GCM10008024_31730 [Allgaiera indica]SDX56330.1 hypothetical protein SAMN05444006_12011 [Allgaiera indica]